MGILLRGLGCRMRIGRFQIGELGADGQADHVREAQAQLGRDSLDPLFHGCGKANRNLFF